LRRNSTGWHDRELIVTTINRELKVGQSGGRRFD
jgi:hypothetical protein